MADHELGGHRHEPIHAGDQLGPVGTVPAYVAFEQIDGVVDQVLDVGDVLYGQGGQLLDGHALADKRAGRGQYLYIVGAELLAFGAVVHRRQQPGVDHQVDDKGGDVGLLGQPGPVEHKTGLVGRQPRRRCPARSPC